jgi:hypothetical protein
LIISVAVSVILNEQNIRILLLIVFESAQQIAALEIGLKLKPFFFIINVLLDYIWLFEQTIIILVKRLNARQVYRIC